MSHGHHTTVCRECNRVLSTCRCSSPNKTITYTVCTACEKKTAQGFFSKAEALSQTVEWALSRYRLSMTAHRVNAEEVCVEIRVEPTIPTRIEHITPDLQFASSVYFVGVAPSWFDALVGALGQFSRWAKEKRGN